MMYTHAFCTVATTLFDSMRAQLLPSHLGMPGLDIILLRAFHRFQYLKP
jgi:hypothetical protein